MSIIVFDDDDGSFFVLVNDEEQHSVCAALADVSSRLAGGLRRSRTRCVSGLHRTELT